MMSLNEVKIAIIGLGYVGLPLAVEFGKQYDTLGFDINAQRVAELSVGHDRTQEVDAVELAGPLRLRFGVDPAELVNCNVFIVTVPTPIDEARRPNLTALFAASQTVGQALRKGDVVIYESTVYPGATEEVCVKEIERASGLKFNTDFTVGYSPERINPGDKQHRLTNIPKVTSGSTPAAADFVDALYNTIITAGTHRASSMKVAEASKVIENTQRDANIALVNEFALIFHRLGIDTHEVLAAAGSKWNFLHFEPGLVGGHCIGVDPYYLIEKAESVGYFPDILQACRRVNDSMGLYVADQVVKLLIVKGHAIARARILILGITFKENCSDVRNTRVIELARAFQVLGAQVDIYDPHADRVEVMHDFGVSLLPALGESGEYDALVIAVAHDEFRQIGIAGLRGFTNEHSVIYDIKGVFGKDEVDGRL